MLTLDAPVCVAPRLVIAVGNPSRGDDALGPLIAERLAALKLPGVEVLSDYQLQIEYALDLRGREDVIFVDAGVSGEAPYTLEAVLPGGDASVTTHALSPQALLAGYRALTGEAPPPAYVLAVRGKSFELGEGLSGEARDSLERAFVALVARLQS